MSTAQYINDTEEGATNGYSFTAEDIDLYVYQTGWVIGDNGAGIVAAQNLDTVYNDGDVFGSSYGVLMTAINDEVVNYDSGLISGKIGGIDFDGNGGALINRGTVTGHTAVIVEGSRFSFINNFGTLSGAIGLDIRGTPKVEIYNAGLVSGSVDAIELAPAAGGSPDGVTITNVATIRGAIDIHASTAAIHNTGTIVGPISFGSGANTFDGLGGTVYGGITGGTGNDIFDLSSQTVSGTVSGGGGEDRVSFASAAAGMMVDLSHGTASGAGETFALSAISDVAGSAYADSITGDGNANYITAGAGADTVSAGPGSDTIYGNGGADILNGNGGADYLIGGAGADTLTGGSGDDVFLYTLVTDSTAALPDTITDFVSGADRINLRALHTHSSDRYTITSNGGYTYVSVDLLGDGTIDTLIKVVGTNAVAASDLVWIKPPPPTMAATEPMIAAHRDLATSAHAIALDHGLYG